MFQSDYLFHRSGLSFSKSVTQESRRTANTRIARLNIEYRVRVIGWPKRPGKHGKEAQHERITNKFGLLCYKITILSKNGKRFRDEAKGKFCGDPGK